MTPTKSEDELRAFEKWLIDTLCEWTDFDPDGQIGMALSSKLSDIRANIQRQHERELEVSEMTPTEQDKLRELVHIVQNADTTYDAIKFITSDRKRVALEARISELKMWELPENEIQMVFANPCNICGLDYPKFRKAQQDRLSALKAQQEEV